MISPLPFAAFAAQSWTRGHRLDHLDEAVPVHEGLELKSAVEQPDQPQDGLDRSTAI
jgi:hypothetical protein